MSSKTNALFLTKFGGYETLQVREIPELVPQKGQVRVSVVACGLNFAEVMARQGLYADAPPTPCILGYEAAGTIDKLGEDVNPKLTIGLRVLVVIRFGAQASSVIASQDQVFPIPDGMTFEEAASIPVNYLTAYQMIFNIANIKPGNRVLVHIAAGGVGLAAAQLCRTIPNITLFGTASKSKHETCKKHGYDHLIDYRTENYETEILRITNNEGVDIVLDPLGGKDWKIGYKLLRPMGKLIMFGGANFMSGETRSIFNLGWQFMQIPSFSPLDLMDKNRVVAGVNLGHLFDQIPLFKASFTDIFDMFNKGKIKPVIDSVYGFAEAGEAHKKITERKNIGKIVLVPVKEQNATTTSN